MPNRWDVRWPYRVASRQALQDLGHARRSRPVTLEAVVQDVVLVGQLSRRRGKHVSKYGTDLVDRLIDGLPLDQGMHWVMTI